MTKVFRLGHFKEWVDTQRGRLFDYHNNRNCAMAQYAKTTWGAENFDCIIPYMVGTGIESKGGVGQIVFTDERIDYPARIERALQSRSFDDLATRLEALL